jgi:hypothetical protein
MKTIEDKALMRIYRKDLTILRKPNARRIAPMMNPTIINPEINGHISSFGNISIPYNH